MIPPAKKTRDTPSVKIDKLQRQINWQYQLLAAAPEDEQNAIRTTIAQLKTRLKEYTS